jgi:hypothetical protein
MPLEKSKVNLTLSGNLVKPNEKTAKFDGLNSANDFHSRTVHMMSKKENTNF